jgi:hypothetical protein
MLSVCCTPLHRSPSTAASSSMRTVPNPAVLLQASNLPWAPALSSAMAEGPADADDSALSPARLTALHEALALAAVPCAAAPAAAAAAAVSRATQCDCCSIPLHAAASVTRASQTTAAASVEAPVEPPAESQAEAVRSDAGAAACVRCAAAERAAEGARSLAARGRARAVEERARSAAELRRARGEIQRLKVRPAEAPACGAHPSNQGNA